MRTDTRIDWHRRVESAICEMMDSLEFPVHFRDISRKVHSSPYHFHRKFRELTGESVQACVKRLRMERAIHLLRHTDRQITEIALDSGYETLESFCKAFKAAFGLKPTEARKFDKWDGKLYSKAGLHYEVNRKSRWFYLSAKGANQVETKIISFPGKRFIGMECIGDYWGLPKAWEAFHAQLKEHQLYGAGKEWMSLFPDHNDVIPMSDKRSYAGFVVEQDFVNEHGLTEWSIPEGLYAVTVHYGSSEEIGPTWDRWIQEWLPESGWERDMDRPMYEWYQNQCVMPELLLTFLVTPVIQKG